MTTPTILRLDDNFRWPGNRRVAVIFNIAYEAWSEGQAPGIGPMGNVLKAGVFDTNADSWASFGAVRGIHRLIGYANQRDIKVSVMTNGVLAQKYPESIKMLTDAGHEVINHSWGMDVIPAYFNEAEEIANLKKNHDILTSAGGVAPVGWISPRGTGSKISPRLLAQAGYLHHGDCNDDDRPYVIDYNGKKIVAIPLTMDVNDLPTTIRYGNAPRHMLEAFNDTFTAMLEREKVPLILDVTAHTHVFGRPSGAWVYDEIMKIVKETPDVWIATRQQIANYVLEKQV
jgi:peptidoglycan/xylan/chitin deacetylase (PgdA/CDA1 family)